ncbi:type 4a pilus biogenesis protein PilO [Candidatus Gottesmanbacteria bacterium]|nr:type 4a pilus biogenesis protein PilO [Candidatus Gottesmanbacteria bacterium]
MQFSKTPKFTPLQQTVSRTYEKVKPLATEKNTGYLMILLSFLSLSFFGIFAIRPTILTAFTLYKEIGDLREINNRYEDKITDVVRAQSEYEQIRDDIPLIYETLPTTPKFPLLISTFEKLATSSSLVLEDMEVDPLPIAPMPESINDLTPFNVKLKLSGDYKNTYTFITNMLNYQRLVYIENMMIATEEATTSGLLTIDFTLTSYYEP